MRASMGLYFLSKNELTAKSNPDMGYFSKIIEWSYPIKSEGPIWATNEKKIKADAKNRKKENKH